MRRGQVGDAWTGAVLRWMGNGSKSPRHSTRPGRDELGVAVSNAKDERGVTSAMPHNFKRAAVSAGGVVAVSCAAVAALALLSGCATPVAPGSIIVGNPQAIDRGTTDRLRTRLIGTWKLVAIRDRNWATGAETPAERAPDGGQLIYAANGRLSVQIVRVGREAEPAGSADGFSSYFGRWQLVPAEGCVIHYQEGNLNVAQIGQAAKRYYSFDSAGHLSLATPPRKVDGKPQPSPVFVWEKIP
jgi:hypothetical protein